MLRPTPKKSPKVALLDTPLPLETSLKDERFVSLAASDGLVQLSFRFNKMIPRLIAPVNQQVIART